MRTRDGVPLSALVSNGIICLYCIYYSHTVFDGMPAYMVVDALLCSAELQLHLLACLLQEETENVQHFAKKFHIIFPLVPPAYTWIIWPKSVHQCVCVCVCIWHGLCVPSGKMSKRSHFSETRYIISCI